ncbi:DUF5107 domain-containing protein [Arthrobacter sp. 35W]|uniref:DUF5107 domain-containing protein n=1 Tax=Arthrobacter sp. 35W TaxID=1132441 RepID=UPI000403BA7A|nr:DUF5107 domain-containing protein [Arthrobacter sp. 35W]
MTNTTQPTAPAATASQSTSTLSVETRTIQLAHLGAESPLPAVQALLEPPYNVGGDIPAHIAAGARYGKARNIYPYQLQDGYSRDTRPTAMTAVVLENAHVRAVFLPELGGRLWELVDKATGKELLHTQDRIQFANLALRNAWFAGGIECNIGTRGHSPTTCIPLHTAIVEAPGGQQVLRMWEFDRLREVVFQIDAWLPADSVVVFVAVRIRNPNAAEVPMYWWTNAAVPQTPGSRVLAPAREAYATDYDGSMTRVVPTSFHGIDASWPMRNTAAADFFFDIPQEQRRWVAMADDDGDGLALVSSPRLRGRKLFVWGETVGGHRWQEWLSPDAGHYTEIQAGLAQTQFEHVPMPAGESWQWVEAYGNAALDPALAHSEDWNAAVVHGSERVDALVDTRAVDRALADAARWADLPPGPLLVAGSGWGALETIRRESAAMTWINATGTPFSPETITSAQEPWVGLLQGESPEDRFAGAPSFVRGQDWVRALMAPEWKSDAPVEPSAEALFHLAVMSHAEGEYAWAVANYWHALDLAGRGGGLSQSSRALALRGLGLALLALADAEADAASGDDNDNAGLPEEPSVDGGLARLRGACAADPGSKWLLAEAMAEHIDRGQAAAALTLVDGAPAELGALGRIRFLTALAHARSGAPETAAAMLKDGLEVPDLREGENSITALWREVCPGESVPQQYQFSMQ